MTDNKIAHKITSTASQINPKTEYKSIKLPKEIYISRKKHEIVDEIKLILIYKGIYIKKILSEAIQQIKYPNLEQKVELK